MRSIPIWGVLCVIGGFLFHLALGYFYTVGNMNTYVISYMNITVSQASWFSSTILALQATFMPLGAYLATKINYRWVILASGIFSSGGIFLTYLTVDFGLGPYVATYCIFFGIGMGLPYSLIFSIASSWFPKHRATVVGIVASGFGLGALVFIPIQSRIINPDNLPQTGGKFPPSVEGNVKKAFLVLGGIVLGLEVIAGLLLRLKSEETSFETETTASSMKTFKERASLSSIDENSTKKQVDTPPAVRSYTVFEAIKSIDFYILWFIVFLDIVSVVLLTSTYKVFGSDGAFDDQFLSAIATTSAAFNCLGRISWGFIVDHFSFKCPMLFFLLLWGTAFVTFPYVTAGLAGKPLYAIWVFILFFCLSAHFVIIPANCTRIFGPANMATIYALVYFATGSIASKSQLWHWCLNIVMIHNLSMVGGMCGRGCGILCTLMCPSALFTAAIVSQFHIQGQWIAVYTACGCLCYLSFALALFVRDKDARCIGFTNKICAAICDPCRQFIPGGDDAVDTPVDVFDVVES